MSTLNVGTTQTTEIDHTNGTSAFLISSGGLVTNPNVPTFYAYQSGSAGATALGAFTTQFNTILVNRGSYYNLTTGRFTAPIAGIYQFQIKLLARYSSAAGAVEITLYKNGANVVSRSCGYAYITGANDHDPITAIVYLSLVANDYVQMGVTTVNAGPDYYYGENLASFCGHLIG
jgi:phage gp36-like protein